MPSEQKAYQAGTFDQQGHRGCRALMPENSIPGMIYALGSPASTLEMDVVISRDQKVLLSHEPYFNHEISTGPKGETITAENEKSYNIYRMDYNEVRRFDVGLKPHPRFPRQQKIPAYKPLLSELIDSVREAMMTRRRPFPYFNIEIKSLPITDHMYHPAPDIFADLVLRVITEKDMRNYCIIQSFDIRPLQYIHRKYPGIPTALLIEEGDQRSLKAQLDELGYTPAVYSPHYSLATPERIREAHDLGMRIVPWTVNDKETIQRLKQSGADGVISDDTGLFD